MATDYGLPGDERIGPLARLYQWCRRNPRIAALAASNIVLLLTLPIISTLSAMRIAEGIRQDQNAHRAAEQTRQEIEAKLQAALEELQTLRQASEEKK